MSFMKCEDVEKALVFYLDTEVASGDRRLIEQHLAGCSACRHKLAALASTRKSAAQALQGLAAKAEPSPQAWDLLQSRLAKEARPMPAKNTVWNARPAPRAGRTLTHTFRGDNKMRTRIMILALLAVVVMAVMGIFLTSNATPVSAQQILERAYEAKTAAVSAQGISHIRVETYLNLQAMGGKSGVEKTIQDGYVDLSNWIYRQVWTNEATGQVLDVSAYDGSYIYTRGAAPVGESSGSLTLYRTPQSIDKVANLKPDTGSVDPENTFETIRQEPDVKQVTKETWTDGREVYVLRAQTPEGAAQKYQVQNFNGDVIMVFDAKTYDLLENSIVMVQDGKEVVLTSYRKLVDETLPANSPVAWDLSDLQGVTRVDDPTGEHGDLLPEVITPQELAAHTQAGYLLKNVPAGFSLEISAPPKQEQEPYYIYIASYRTAENDSFVIQSGKAPEKLANLGKDTYQTASGLTLYFLPSIQEQGSKAKVITQTIVAAPDGAQFIISSTLPRERVQELAEDLVLVK
ncbi:MAG TPA: zf-HC2 domain-containing protein [Anaerolineaceae bacterium]